MSENNADREPRYRVAPLGEFKEDVVVERRDGADVVICDVASDTPVHRVARALVDRLNVLQRKIESLEAENVDLSNRLSASGLL